MENNQVKGFLQKKHSKVSAINGKNFIHDFNGMI
jgi:hypothetical protein